MVIIKHTPIESIYVFEYVREKYPEDLAMPSGLLASATGQIMALNWAEGIVFLFSAILPNTDAAFLKLLEGKLYSPSIHYTEMPEYLPSIQTDQGIHVPVVDVTASQIMKELALWLKQREVKAKYTGDENKPDTGSGMDDYHLYLANEEETIKNNPKYKKFFEKESDIITKEAQ